MIDVFFDRLDYNHPIDYRGRLEFHPDCVSLADLMLQKLQIVQINDKDLKDAMLLLLAAPLSEYRFKWDQCQVHQQIICRGLGLLLYSHDQFEEDQGCSHPSESVE